MTVTLTITKVKGGFLVEIPEYEESAVGTTPRQAAMRAKDMLEMVLTEAEKE